MRIPISSKLISALAIVFIALGLCLPQALPARAAPAPEETARRALVAPETISSGMYHTCAIKTDGTVACWGFEFEGSTFPPAGTFAQVSAGTYHNCAVKSDGTLACWGWNLSHQANPPAGTFFQVSAGESHSCGIRSDGTLACWGSNGYGQLNHPGGTFTQITAGSHHTCGLKTDGTLACWGHNTSGQANPPAGSFTQVSAGWAHTCGLKSDGTLACWGNNDYLQVNPPVGTFTQVITGGDHSCGIKTDGSVACWGSDVEGESTPPAGTFNQVGLGMFHTCGLKSDGTLACWGYDEYGITDPPTGSFGQRQVTAGFQHTCGLRGDGTLTCWGNNGDGQSTPPSGIFTQVSAGIQHNCALKSDGTIACWGSNSHNQINPPGGTFTQITSGVQHNCALKTDGTMSCWGNNGLGQNNPPSGTFTQVSAGGYHTCGLKIDGTLACWGNNYSGQTNAPAGTFTQASAGFDHTCGLKSDGTLACWGYNNYGQASPPAGTFIQVSAGESHSCGLRSDGTVACWGGNSYGQSSAPVGTFTQIIAAFFHSCGVRSDGTITCWGQNNYSQFHLISLSPTSLPAGAVGEAYSQVITAAGGTEPYTFKVAAGSLPAGLSLSETGILSGTPSSGGIINLTIQATDATPGFPFSGQREYTLVIYRPPTGANAAVNPSEDTQFTFSQADFPYNDLDGDAFAGIQIASPQSAGDLECAGIDVQVDDLCTNVNQLVFTPEPDENGSPYATFEYWVRDARGATSTSSYTMTINVGPVNDAPVLSEIDDLSGDEETGFSFTASASDIDLPANHLTFSLDPGAPAGAAIDPETGEFEWTPDELQGPDIYTVTVRVNDNGTPNLDDFQLVQIEVGEVNTAPILGVIGSQSIDETSEIAFTASVTDLDLPTNDLTFSLDPGAPTGAAIDALTGEFAWTPDETLGSSIFTFTVRVSDNAVPALEDFETFQIEVLDTNSYPTLGEIGNQTVEETTPITFTAQAEDSDIPTNSLAFSLDAGAPEGATLNPTTGEFAWTPDETQGSSVFTFTVRVTDNGTPVLDDFETFQIEVIDTNSSPTLEEIDDQSGDELTEIAFTAQAADGDDPADSLNFSLDPGAPDGTTIDPETGDFSWIPDESQGPATYTVTVRVTDSGNPAMSDYENIHISVDEVNIAPDLNEIDDQTGDELAEISFIAQVDDPDLPANELTFSLDSGAPGGAAIDPATGEFTWTPDEEQGPGTYTVTVRVNDNGTPAFEDFQTFQIEVNEVNSDPLAVLDTYDAIEDTPLVVAAPGVLGNDIDPDIPIQTLTAELVTGPEEGELTLELDGSFVYTPTQNFNGTITFVYSVNDGQASDAGIAFIEVGPVNDPPVVEAGDDLSGVEGSPVQFAGSYVDPGRGPDAAGIAWDFGDGTRATGSLDPQHTYLQDGVFTATLTITDELGGVGMDWLLVTVENAAPELDAISDQAATAGVPLVLDVTWNDAGLLDEHTIQINWGDGLTETIEVEAGVFQVELAHTYARAGVFNPTVTLRDDAGAVDEGSFEVIVLYRLWLPAVWR